MRLTLSLRAAFTRGSSAAPGAARCLPPPPCRAGGAGEGLCGQHDCTVTAGPSSSSPPPRPHTHGRPPPVSAAREAPRPLARLQRDARPPAERSAPIGCGRLSLSAGERGCAARRRLGLPGRGPARRAELEWGGRGLREAAVRKVLEAPQSFRGQNPGQKLREKPPGAACGGSLPRRRERGRFAGGSLLRPRLALRRRYSVTPGTARACRTPPELAARAWGHQRQLLAAN